MTYDLVFRQKVLNCYNNNLLPIAQLVKVFSISKTTLYNWINQGIEIKDRTNKLTEHAIKYILSYADKHANFNIKIIIKQIYIKYHISVKKTTIYKILKTNGYKKKKIDVRYIPIKKNRRNKLLKQLKQSIDNTNIDNLLSLDECSIDTHINHNSGWSSKGAKLTQIKKHTRQRYTVISVISNKKVMNTKIIKGSCNGEQFKKFIDETIELLGNTNYSILLDNARIHHSRLIKQMQNQQLKFIYNLPYSPEYNPIEHVFSKIKNIIKNKTNTNKNIIKHINTSFKQITRTNLRNYYATCIEKLNK